MNGLEMEFCGLWVMFHLMWFDYWSVFLKDLLLFFSLLGYQKFLGFHSPWFQKSVCLGAKIRFMFSSKRVVLSFLVLLFSTHVYHLAVPFLGDRLLWQAYVLEYFGHSWTRNGWSLRVRHCSFLLVVRVFSFFFLRSKRDVPISGHWVKASIL